MPSPNEASASGVPEPSWAERYGDKHRWRRFVAFPAGLAAPRKVRIYWRDGHFLLNYWDPSDKKNRSERVTGDLLEAITRAREIDERIMTRRTAGSAPADDSATPTWSGTT